MWGRLLKFCRNLDFETVQWVGCFTGIGFEHTQFWSFVRRLQHFVVEVVDIRRSDLAAAYVILGLPYSGTAGPGDSIVKENTDHLHKQPVRIFACRFKRHSATPKPKPPKHTTNTTLVECTLDNLPKPSQDPNLPRDERTESIIHRLID